MIKVDLITGFLGSGKTTFLLRYVKWLKSKGLKIGILEYDYGAVNVDMLLLGGLRGAGCELEMLAAACDSDCLQRRFRTKLIAMAMNGYDRVVIEPSGVFDMDLFFDALREEPLENWYEIGSVITVVSGNLPPLMSEEAEYLLASQAAFSGCVLFSKVQLCTEQELEETKEHIARAMKGISCKKYRENYFAKDWDTLTDGDFQKLSGAGYQIGDYVKRQVGGEDGFSSVSFLNPPEDLDELKRRVKVLFETDSYGNVFRVKGFARAKDGTNYQVSAASSEVTAQPVSIGQRVLIVIGTALCEERIRELIEA